MWPEPGEALDRTIAFEATMEDLYAEALRRWHPALKATVLPTLTAAGELPPDPAAAQEQANDEWAELAVAVVVAGATMLWVAAVIEAYQGLDIPLPELPQLTRPERQGVIVMRELMMEDTAVVRRVLAHTDMTHTEMADAIDLVDTNAALAAARDDFVEAQTARADAVPAVVRDQLARRVEAADQMAADAGVAPAVRTTDTRAAALATIDPAGPDMREIARTAGYQAASVQNHAIMTTALQAEDAADLEKTWIATIDGKTRPTHWAADGQRAPLAGSFIVGGEALAFPADPGGSPREVKNCRCRMGVLAKDEELPTDIDRHTERLNGGDAVQRNRQGSQADEIERRDARGNVRARDTTDGVGTVASGGWAAPSEQEMDMAGKSTTTTGTALAAQEDDAEAGTTYRTFTNAVVALVGEPTSDARMLAKDIELSMRTFPHPLMWQEQTDYGHGGSYVVGVVESAELSDGKVLASGYLLNDEHADAAMELLAHKVTSPSIDLASSEWVMTDKDGNEIEYDDYIQSIEDGDPIDLYTTVISAELIGTTLVATAAFGDTSLTLNAERETREVPLVAAAVLAFTPRTFAAAHFADPELTAPTRTVVTEDGRTFGHIACWDSKHRSVGLGNIDPPRNPGTGYREFHTSPAVRLDDGTDLAVGRLTVGIGHASTAASVTGPQAAAHYDNADACWALVRVGEDAHGIWFSGVVAPWADQSTIEKGAGAPLSGDWRDFGNGYEMVAALAVNTPGFNVRGATDRNGRPLAMVASMGPVETAQGGVANLTPEDFAAAVLKAMNDQQAATALAAERDQLLAQADAGGLPPTPAEAIADMLSRRAQ